MSNRIIIEGKDYDNISECKITKKPESVKDEDEKTTILKMFLPEAQKKIKKISSSISFRDKNSLSQSEETKNTSNEKKKKLYNPFSDEEEPSQFGGIVGVYRDKKFKYREKEYYDVTLRIRSRMDEDGKFYFLQAMLEKAVPNLKYPDNEVLSDEEDVFRFLYIYIYRNQILDTWRLGLYKTYQRFEKNDERIRGSIDVARHIRLNMGINNGKVAYSYRERTADNPFNHLILHTYDVLKRDFPELVEAAIDRDFEMRSVINELRMEAPSYQNYPVSTVMNKMNAPITHPFFQPYEKLRKTCMDILHYCGVSVFGEEEPETQGILFYVPDLWEGFVFDILSRAMAKSDRANKIELTEQKEIKYFFSLKPESKENKKLNFEEFIKEFKNSNAESLSDYLRNKFAKEEIADKKKGRPDYVFQINGKESEQIFLVLDAKCKPDWNEKKKDRKWLNVDGDCNKCIRDMTIAGAHATGVVYPKKLKQSDTKAPEIEVIPHIFSKSNQEDFFYEIAIGIPEINGDESYGEWKKKLEENSRLETIKSLIEFEYERKIGKKS